MEQQPKKYHLYVLELEDGKYYVGITARTDPQVRINQHIAGTGARWVRLHKYVNTLEMIDLGITTLEAAERREQSVTLEYMARYGHNNVRGGTLSHTYNYLKIGGNLYHFSKDQLITLAWYLLLLMIVGTLGYVIGVSR